MDEEWMDPIRQGLLCLLEETLHSHQGVYTAEGTSLVETLRGIDATTASRRVPGLPETIAGHVHHARAYLLNTLGLLEGTGTGEMDVAESWKVDGVDPAGWLALQARLSETYQAVMGRISRLTPDDVMALLPAILGLIAHSAYHLGAIRQLKDWAG